MMKNDHWSAIEELSKHKRLYIYTCAVAILCSLAVSLSIPTQYVSRIILTPETKFFELNVGAAKGSAFSQSESDQPYGSASGPDVYIQILNSNDFRNLVKQLCVRTSDSTFVGTYEEYLKTRMKYPWYYNLIYVHSIDDIIDENIRYSLDRSNATITIQASSCDPLVSAMMPEMLRDILHEKITERYHNLYVNLASDMASKFEDAKKDYHEKMKEYSDFRDSHEGIKDKTYMTVQTALQKDMRTAYATCEKFRVLNERYLMLSVKQNVYLTTLINPVVARSATNPHYIANAILWLFYALVFTTLFILYRKKINIAFGKEAVNG